MIGHVHLEGGAPKVGVRELEWWYEDFALSYANLAHQVYSYSRLVRSMVCALTEQEGSGLLRKIRIAQIGKEPTQYYLEWPERSKENHLCLLPAPQISTLWLKRGSSRSLWEHCGIWPNLSMTFFHWNFKATYASSSKLFSVWSNVLGLFFLLY